jgi:hypothetical protein
VNETHTSETDETAIPDDGRAWYIVQTYSGYENKVKTSLEQRIKAMDLGASATQSVVLMVILVGLTVIQFRYVERRVHY